MKKLAVVLFLFAGTLAHAQMQQNMQPQVTVTGEGKIKVTPDEAVITIGVENIGADATEVKKKNDVAIEAIIKYLKNAKVPATDYQTQRVSLNRNYDYEKKKYTSFVATQTIVIKLKDLTKYDALMMGVVDAGANTIQGVEFKTSKLAQYESEARKAAVLQARVKADDYVTALGQKAGKAIVINENSQTYYPVMHTMNMKAEMSADIPRETLAIGEIEVTANVNVSFKILD